MATLPKKTLPRHLVVPDTNILWFKDKSVVVCPEFDSFWVANSGLIDMELIVPDVVLGELLYQQATSGIKALQAANTRFDDISSITGEKYSHRVTEKRIRKRVEDRFSKWLKQKKGRTQPTPISEIDWAAMVRDSIWRVPPFSGDPKNPEMEKGFRDALILETVSRVCEECPSGCHIVFVCNDYLLRTTAEKRLGKHKCFATYESLAELQSYINLTQEELTEKFVNAIVPRAERKFWKSGDDSCLYVRESIYAKIRQEHDDTLRNPKEPSDTLLPSLGVTAIPWSPASQETIVLSRPQFVKLVDKNVFHWKSVLNLVQLFRRSTSAMYLGAEPTVDERVRVSVFNALWHAMVKADGRFHDVTLDHIEKVEQSLAEPTTDQIRRFGLPTVGA